MLASALLHGVGLAAGGWLHVDAIQAAGKVAVDSRAIGADTLSISAHKIGGPMGVGLGTLLHQGRTESDLAVVLCAVLAILAVGVLVELTAFGPVERRMLRRRGLLEGSTR